jgi:hypothetical protein
LRQIARVTFLFCNAVLSDVIYCSAKRVDLRRK